ncbi:MAG: FkbM family methyltransferase [Ignavibacteria bacterium]
MANSKFPYVENFELGNINFKYWVTSQYYEENYKPKEWKEWCLTSEYKNFIKKGDRILEIGSGNGFTTCLLKSLTGDEGLVVGLELVPENCLIANSQIALNNFDNCYILNYAAYHLNGKEHYTDNGTGNGKLIYSDSDQYSKIDTIVCDNLIKEFGHFDVIVIDVNGFELNVLRGATTIINSQTKVILNVVEFENELLKSNYLEILKLINAEKRKGSIYYFDEQKIFPFDFDTVSKEKKYAKVLLDSYSDVKKVSSNVTYEIEDQKFLEKVYDYIQKNNKYYELSEKHWLKYYFNKPISKKRREGNVAMFHLGRCGSSVLGHMLNENPNIFWDGENIGNFYLKKLEVGKLNEDVKHLSDIVAEVDELYMTDNLQTYLKIRMYRSQKKIFGFETKFSKYEHLRKDLLNLNINEYIEFLIQNGFNYFITLKRDNYLKQILSYYIAEKTKVYHTSKEITKPTSIFLDVNKCWIGNREDSLIGILEEMDKEYHELQDILVDKNHLDLIYEEDIQADPLIGYKKICDFINVEYYSPNIVLKRTNPYKISEMIENFDEIKEYLGNSKYDWMVDE